MTDVYQITINEFKTMLKSLLKEKTVEKVISGVEKRNHFTISPSMVTDENEIDNIPLSQMFVYNFSRIDSAAKFLHKKGGALNEKVALIGHPCDGRALVELSKKLQVNLDNIFTVIMEDIGTILNKTLKKLLKDEGIDEKSLVDEFLTPEKLYLKLDDNSIKEYKLGDKIDINANCRRCFRKKLDKNFDFSITTLSTEPFSGNLILKVGSAKGKEALLKSKIKLTSLKQGEIEKLESIQSDMIEKAKIRRDKELEEWLNKPDRIAEIAKCTMCGLCINSCPVCFCKDCILKKQRKEKSIDKLSYQLTRIAHIGDACVGCGKCDQNCPPGLPLSLYFQSLNDSVKKSFDYVAGCERDTPMPRSKEVVKELN